MLLQEQISAVIDSQRDNFIHKDSEIIRESLGKVPIINSYATILTGLRRCGKSTLLLQLMRDKEQDAIYFNFEDIRLAGFETSDFTRLLNEITRRGVKMLFFDEIQLTNNWEIFINQLLRDGYTVFITGSNASLLSKELGTHLTGRHISIEIFPFSYREFAEFKKTGYTNESLNNYLHSGGIPEYVRSGAGILLTSLVEDILIRDIAIRHSIRDVESLKQLTVYLISNIGNLVSANKLTGMFGIRSSATILDYFSFLKDSYLIELMPAFSYSLKAQARNPKKIYVLDMGITSEVSTAFTDNLGHKLENLVYLHLRRHYKELFYFKEKGECDFIAFDKGKASLAVQVCFKVEDANFEREYNGLLEAMKEFNLKEGTIVTFDQKDSIIKDGLTVTLIPAHEYLSTLRP